MDSKIIDWKKDWLENDQNDCRAFVYLAEADLSGVKKLKMGRTWNVRLRMQRLSSEKKSAIKLLAFIPCSNEDESIQLESYLHRRHRVFGTRGEWYVWSEFIKNEFLSLKGVVNADR